MSKFAPLLLCFALLSPGCYLFTPVNNGPTPVVETTKQISLDVRDSLKSATADDCNFLYGLCNGMALYIERQRANKTTNDLFSLLSKAEDDLQWPKNKYSTFNDVTEKHLKSLGFEDNKTVDDATRKTLVETFRDFAKGCELAHDAAPKSGS